MLRSGDRYPLHEGFRTVDAAWQFARSRLQFETRLWVGREGNPDSLVMY